MPDDNKNSTNSKNDSVPERVTFWLSLLLMLSLFGFLGYSAVRDGRGAKLPQATVTADVSRAERMDAAHWLVPVSVRNTGVLALEEVNVRVSYRSIKGDEDADLSFSYLAGWASDHAFVVTDLPPKEAKVRVFIQTVQTQRNARGY